MKMKTNHIGIIRQSLGWLTVGACAGLAVGALTYYALEHKLERVEQNAELTGYMVQTVRLDGMLRQIGEGRTVEAKKQLTSELALDVSMVKSMSGSAEGCAQDLAGDLVVQVMKHEKKHPEYYLASAQLGTIDSGGVIQVVRH